MRAKVCIITVTYNQSKYISQALDSFLSQKTDFPFTVIVADDCSTDGAQEIIKEYAKNYPQIIKPILRHVNIGVQNNFVDAAKRCDSDYMAICDGDDYWIDNNKLQKQVNFLEKNKDYSLCFHAVEVLYGDFRKKNEIYPKNMPSNPQSLFNLIKYNYIPSNSVMYRTAAIKNLFDNDYPSNIYPCDWYHHISCALNGKIGYINKCMSVYRRYSNGISSTVSEDPVGEIHLKYGINEVNFSYAVWLKIKNRFPLYYETIFIQVLIEVYLTYLKELRFDDICKLTGKYSKFFNDIKYSSSLKYKLEVYKEKVIKYKKLYKLFLSFSIVLCFLVIYAIYYILDVI